MQTLVVLLQMMMLLFISTPYLTAELFDIKFAQSADVMYLTHPRDRDWET